MDSEDVEDEESLDGSEALESDEESEVVRKPAKKKANPLKSAHSVASSSASTKSLKKLKGKLIHFDSVNIPKGDTSIIDKFISTRTNSEGIEQVLVKYKVWNNTTLKSN